jgi:hypothetical protein
MQLKVSKNGTNQQNALQVNKGGSTPMKCCSSRRFVRFGTRSNPQLGNHILVWKMLIENGVLEWHYM